MEKYLVFAAVIAVAGCAGTNFAWEDADKIKNGMTEAEVVEILGRPYLRQQSGNGVVLAWSHASAFGGAKAVSFRFVDGKVVGGSTINK